MDKWQQYEAEKKKVIHWINQGVDLDFEYEIQRIIERLKL